MKFAAARIVFVLGAALVPSLTLAAPARAASALPTLDRKQLATPTFIEHIPAITREAIGRAIAEVDAGQQAPARPNDDNAWAPVRLLSARANIRVVLDDATSHRGWFSTADDTAITLFTVGGSARFPRERVRQVTVKGGHKALIGGALGIPAGLLGGALACRGQPAECAQSRPVIGLGLGIVAGAIVGAAWPAWKAVYVRR